MIDPTGKLIQHRFFRQHCSSIEHNNKTLFVKDLSLFKNLDLKKVLFVDNHIFSFAANLKNGIPVVDYLGDINDCELLKVANYVVNLSKEENLMKANDRVFGLQQIKNTDISSFIKFYGVDELTEHVETDFDDDGDTVKSALLQNYDSSEEELDRMPFGVPETIVEIMEDCTPTVVVDNSTNSFQFLVGQTKNQMTPKNIQVERSCHNMSNEDQVEEPTLINI